MVVDPRGMDELLQALGRGRRHRRAPDGRLLPTGSPDGRPPATMLVLAPDPGSVTSEAWLRDLVGWGGAKVAGNVARAWRTASLLHHVGCVHYGEERRLVEAAASPATVPTPSALTDGDVEAEVATLSRRGLARTTQARALRVATGYVSSGIAPADDERVETRIDEVGALEVFLIDGRDGYRPLGGWKYEWSDGRIRIPARWLAEGGMARAREIASEAGLPRGALAVPVRREGMLWVHHGAVFGGFVVDPRWGLRWHTGEGITAHSQMRVEPDFATGRCIGW